MKISEKQFKGKSFTFTIPYLGNSMGLGEDNNGKKTWTVAGKEGLKITVNGIDISNEVYIDADLTIKASDARYYHSISIVYFANVTNVTLDSNDSIVVKGFFLQEDIDYLSTSTGGVWAMASSTSAEWKLGGWNMYAYYVYYAAAYNNPAYLNFASRGAATSVTIKDDSGAIIAGPFTDWPSNVSYPYNDANAVWTGIITGPEWTFDVPSTTQYIDIDWTGGADHATIGSYFSYGSSYNANNATRYFSGGRYGCFRLEVEGHDATTLATGCDTGAVYSGYAWVSANPARDWSNEFGAYPTIPATGAFTPTATGNAPSTLTSGTIRITNPDA